MTIDFLTVYQAPIKKKRKFIKINLHLFVVLSFLLTGLFIYNHQIKTMYYKKMYVHQYWRNKHNHLLAKLLFLDKQYRHHLKLIQTIQMFLTYKDINIQSLSIHRNMMRINFITDTTVNVAQMETSLIALHLLRKLTLLSLVKTHGGSEIDLQAILV